MKKLALAIALALGSASAPAWDFQYGGDADASARSNASSSSRAYGGNARAYGGSANASVNSSNSNKNYNKNYNTNNNTMLQFSDLNNRQRQSQGQGQLQGNVGLGSGNSTTTGVVTTVEGDTYEAPKKPDVPAYAPDAIATPATAPCIVGIAGSGGFGGIVSLGASGFVKDHGCAMGEVARRANAIGDKETAQEALDLMFQIVKREAGVKEDVPGNTVATAPTYSDDSGFDWQRSYE